MYTKRCTYVSAAPAPKKREKMQEKGSSARVTGDLRTSSVLTSRVNKAGVPEKKEFFFLFLAVLKKKKKKLK